MKGLWKLVQVLTSFVLLVGLVFASGVFSVLLYGRITDKEWAFSYGRTGSIAFARQAVETATPSLISPTPKPTPVPKKESVLLNAPVISQYPELPSGCEITSLTMLLHYYGVNKDKLELASAMKKDPTPMVKAPNGTIRSWGNPNDGFVGDVTGKTRGFGIYHGPLFELLKAEVPTAKDLSGSAYEALEKQLADGIPVVTWTTVDFQVPDSHWVVWNTPSGPIQTTFMEHAVLLVGYDKDNVYVNDPRSGEAQVKVNKAAFQAAWEAMGKQALTYERKLS